jgi:hypothetical protein
MVALLIFSLIWTRFGSREWGDNAMHDESPSRRFWNGGSLAAIARSSTLSDERTKMQTLEIQPTVGVGPIRFGMSRAEVRELIGPHDGDSDEDREWYLEDLAIEFDSSGKVAFIEIAESENFRAVLNGECLHELDADSAIAHVKKSAAYDPNAPEPGYTYVFPALQLSLWRPVVPDASQDADDPTGRAFEAVGVGRTGYFK